MIFFSFLAVQPHPTLTLRPVPEEKNPPLPLVTVGLITNNKKEKEENRGKKEVAKGQKSLGYGKTFRT